MSNIKCEYKFGNKFILSAIVAFLVPAVLFLILQNTAHYLIHIYCEKPEVIAAHFEKKADSLQQYIKSRDLSLSNISALDEWREREDLTEVAIYYGNQQLYSSSMAFPNLSHQSEAENGTFAWNNGHRLAFRDGEAIAFINDLFVHRYTDYATYLDLLIFFLCFITIMIFFIRKKVSYINILVQEIRVLEGGELHYAITVKGTDELASLAQGIDEMRKAFIAREQYAGRVTTASNELMTGISHDLRTPLTALIGYLEVMEGEEIPAGQSPFLQKCKNRAFQIKNLINNLFEYFFVSASEDTQFQLRSCLVKEALNEVIQEHVLLVEQSGFTVVNMIELPDAIMQVECSIVQRIFDNLLSNIRRYADPAFPIQLKSTTQAGEMVLTIDNHVRRSSEMLESTGLGLKACEKMLLLHRGQFVHQRQNDIYTVRLQFPLI